MTDNVVKTLSYIDKTMWVMDNNQRGHHLKYQQFVSPNKFVKVTDRTIRKYITCDKDIGNENEKRVQISYIDQLIVNPINFSVFEK